MLRSGKYYSNLHRWQLEGSPYQTHIMVKKANVVKVWSLVHAEMCFCSPRLYWVIIWVAIHFLPAWTALADFQIWRLLVCCSGVLYFYKKCFAFVVNHSHLQMFFFKLYFTASNCDNLWFLALMLLFFTCI